ncbi:MAG: hypothetical protein ACLVJO_16115 [[Clostridium] scindens]
MADKFAELVEEETDGMLRSPFIPMTKRGEEPYEGEMIAERRRSGCLCDLRYGSH